MLPYVVFEDWEKAPEIAKDTPRNDDALTIPWINHRVFYVAAMNRISSDKWIDMGPIFKSEPLAPPRDLSTLTPEERQSLVHTLALRVRRRAAAAVTQSNYPDYAAYQEGALAQELSPYLPYPDLLEEVVSRAVYRSEQEFFAGLGQRDTGHKSRI